MSKTDSGELERTQASQAEGSDKGSGQQSSEPEYVTVEQFNKLQGTLETLTRSLQSDKDRAVKKTNQRLDEIEGPLKTVLQKAGERGLSIAQLLEETEKAEEAKFKEEMKAMAQAFQSGAFPQSASPGSGGQEGVDVSAVLKDLELDLNDTRVKEFATRQFGSVADAYKEGAKLIKSISTRQPTDADKPGGTSERAAAEGKQEQLMNEYKEGSKKLFGKPLIDFKMQMRKKGLKIS